MRLPAAVRPDALAKAPREIVRALAATNDERDAATAVTAHLLLRADAVNEDGPLTHGWAIHAAFLAGVRWRERQGE